VQDDTGKATAVRGSDFAVLARRVGRAGLLDRRPGYYAIRTGVTLALFAGGWAAFFIVGDSWYQILVAVLLAFAFTQVAFLGHDVGHRQVFRTRRASEIAGLGGNLSIGLGYGWWMDKHNRHHANPNHVDRDPDVGAGALVWTVEQAVGRTGIAGFLGRRQAVLFFPLCLLEGMNLHVASVRALFQGVVKHRWLEGILLAVHFAGYIALLLLALPVGKALVFAAVHQGLWGLYMGSAFAPNHKGMEMITAEDDRDFLRRQVLTSRNIRGGRVIDYLMGGLNYQVEHHLFPSMPSGSLRRAQPIVRAYCAEIGVAYHETGLIDSYGQALRHMHSVGAELRAAGSLTAG
jgi:fatty acid desaturase